MEDTTYKRVTRSQALKKRLLDADAGKDKAAETSPPPSPKPARKISRTSTRRAAAQSRKRVTRSQTLQRGLSGAATAAADKDKAADTSPPSPKPAKKISRASTRRAAAQSHKRVTRSQTLQRGPSGAATAAADKDKAADTSPPSPKPARQISQVPTLRTRTQSAEPPPQPIQENPIPLFGRGLIPYFVRPEPESESQPEPESEYQPEYQPEPESESQLGPESQSLPEYQPQPLTQTPTFLPYQKDNLRYLLVLDWIASIGTDLNIRHNRSESNLQLQLTNNNNNHISGRKVASEPTMSLERHANNWLSQAVQNRMSTANTRKTPAFEFGITFTPPQPTKPLVEQAFYRAENLFMNNILMWNPTEQLPGHITDLIDLIRQDRNAVTHAQAEQMYASWLGFFGMQHQAIQESEVEDYFSQNILPKRTVSDCLQNDKKANMLGHVVPNTSLVYQISRPKPDMLYGYSANISFFVRLAQILPLVNQVAANSLRSMYPFLVFKFKGDSGSMWVATNQCLGASASCVFLANDINTRLEACKSEKRISNAAFSVASNGTEATIYVSWKHGINYYTATVQSVSLRDPDGCVNLYKCIHNILDWGRGQRLEEIREALNIYLEACQETPPESAKSRSPPEASDQRCTKRQKMMPSQIAEEIEEDDD